MSIDNLNAEHRGQLNILPPSLRRRQCCSFCRQHGHNLTTCNNDRLREFEVICATQVLQINTYDDFKNWLIQNYMSEPLLIKAFAIKKFKITTRTNIEICMDLITEYIFRIYKNTNETIEIVERENQFENDLMTFIQALSTERQQEIQEEIQEERRISEYQQNMVMENMLIREMFIHMMSRMINRTSREEEHRKFKIVSTINENENINIDQLCECSICYDNKEFKNFVKLTCKHEFCKECIIETMKISQNNKLCCALCRGEVKTIESRTNVIGNEISVYIE
jgi:hypothetical protein